MPLISARPAVGLISPRSSRSVVDLPAPFGPRNPNTSPVGDVERQGVERHDRSPNRFVSPSVRIAGADLPLLIVANRSRAIVVHRVPGTDRIDRSTSGGREGGEDLVDEELGGDADVVAVGAEAWVR